MLNQSMKWITVGLISCCLTAPCFAKGSKSSGAKMGTMYFQGSYGNTVALDDKKTVHTKLASETKTFDNSSGYQLALGARFSKYFGIEAVYGDFGSPSVVYTDKFSVEKSIHYAGGAG